MACGGLQTSRHAEWVRPSDSTQVRHASKLVLWQMNSNAPQRRPLQQQKLEHPVQQPTIQLWLLPAHCPAPCNMKVKACIFGGFSRCYGCCCSSSLHSYQDSIDSRIFCTQESKPSSPQAQTSWFKDRRMGLPRRSKFKASLCMLWVVVPSARK